MVKGGHRTGRIATHQCCHAGTWYVMLDEEEMERTLGVQIPQDIVTCEVPYGGVLFMNNLIPHRRSVYVGERKKLSYHLVYSARNFVPILGL